jgi:arylsulfatase
MNEQRQIYDEYVANVDEEFGRLYDHLQVNGVLDNSYLILTSDHGEAFERGVIGHSTPLVLEPGIHVPLVISAPGQTQHQDIRSLTSTVDLLPTLAEIAGLPTPAWGQGLTLPGFSASQEFDRGINVIEAKRNPAHQVLDKATVCLIKGPYKLVHFLGYRYGRDDYEFYDLENDPEEMNDQYASHPAVQDLKHELDQQLAEANQPYIH